MHLVKQRACKPARQRMLATNDQKPGREFGFTTHDFEIVRALLYRNTGISLNDSKDDLAYGRLSRRLRATGFSDFSGYLSFVTSPQGEIELGHFINALTTNLTAFFREPHHFEYFRNITLPDSVKRHAQDRRIRYWSAGCSTGEEAYSLAMVVRETLLTDHGLDLKILATDLDSSVLETARCGRYAIRRIAGLSRQRSAKWFSRKGGCQGDEVQVAPSLQDLISFKQLNLMQDWPMRGPFDAIFCRNVVIYFDKATQKKLFDRFADLLVDGGHLYLGHSESMHGISDRFEFIGQTMYRKLGRV